MAGAGGRVCCRHGVGGLQKGVGKGVIMTTLEFLKKIGAVTVPDRVIQQAEENTKKDRDAGKKDATLKSAQ